jgi:hypothetical protein
VAADEAARRRGSREAVRREAAMRACGAAGHHGESRMVRLNDAGSRRGVRGFAVRAQPAGSRPPQPSVSTRPHVWRRGTACVRADVSLALSLARVAAASRGMAPPCTHGSAKDDPAHAGRRNPRVPPCSVSRAWLDAGPASVLSSCFCLFAHLFANFIDSLAMCPAGRPVPLGRTATPFYAR